MYQKAKKGPERISSDPANDEQSVTQETKRRLNVLRAFNKHAKKQADGIILVGSVAYGAKTNEVHKNSDLDLILIFEGLDKAADVFFSDPDENRHLKTTPYDGFMTKVIMGEDIPVSIHCMSMDTYKKIARGHCENLTYYRKTYKDIAYYSKDFFGENHEFHVTNTPTGDLSGFKRVDPIAFTRNGNYVIGNDIDKILSGAKILHDKKGKVGQITHELWQNLFDRLHHAAKSAGQTENEDFYDLNRLLFRRDRFNALTRKHISEKSKRYAKRAKRRVQ